MTETLMLTEALEQVLSRYFDKVCHINSIERRPYPYRSSFELEEIVVHLAGGSALSVMFKNLSWEGLPQSVRDAKPHFLYDPRREIEAYSIFLAKAHLGTPTFYGAAIDDQTNCCWLFLERVFGKELYQIGEFESWKQVARWLAKLHSSGQSLVILPQQGERTRLIRYDGDFYSRWLRRADTLLLHTMPVIEGERRRQTSWLLKCYTQVIEFLLTLPKTLIHGEFYPSNVLVQSTGAGLRICPVDWEMAALGPGLMDLAALTSGKWSEEQRREMAHAYVTELCTKGEQSLPVDQFFTSLDYCRLHLAVQWLGWSALWSAPPQHAQDWLNEGLHLAEKLNL